VPWVDRAPVEIIREHVRLTLQPLDAPPSAEAVARLCEHLGSDEMLLFSSDYPHWHFDGDDALPAGLPDQTVARLLARNPQETYTRIGGTA
jgi:predicted TIM-barrel fold metal-dependent hydrolase